WLLRRRTRHRARADGADPAVHRCGPRLDRQEHALAPQAGRLRRGGPAAGRRGVHSGHRPVPLTTAHPRRLPPAGGPNTTKAPHPDGCGAFVVWGYWLMSRTAPRSADVAIFA